MTLIFIRGDNTDTLLGLSGNSLILSFHARKYEDFLYRGPILISKLLKQGYSSQKLLSIFRKFYGRHTNLVHKFDTSVSHMLNGLFIETYDWLPVIYGKS